jgi:hypothetical protein
MPPNDQPLVQMSLFPILEARKPAGRIEIRGKENVPV